MGGSTPADVTDLTVDPNVALALMGDHNRIVLDHFAGPGGWSTGIADVLDTAGLREVGLEWDASAFLTRIANGHTGTIRADVAAYPLAPFLGRTAGYIGSPPCQTFSMAGDGAGRGHLDLLCVCVRGVLLGRMTYDEAMAQLEAAGALDDKDGNPDPRNGLILIPARTIRALLDHDGLGPTDLEWIALEQVPPAGPVFDAYAMALHELGFSVAAPIINAADYGVPQTRRRKFVLASRVRRVTVPEPSHVEGGEPADLFGPGRLPWVSMAGALGWGMTDRSYVTVTGGRPDSGGGKDYGSRQFVGTPEALDAILEARLAGSDKFNGHDSEKTRNDGLRITEAEGGILQGFPVDYLWEGGSKGKRWEQIGNVVCPPVARRIIAELTGVDAAPLPWHRYAFEEAEDAVPFG